MKNFNLIFLVFLSTNAIAQSLKDEYNACAVEFSLQENYPAAIEYFTYVIELNPNDSIAYFDRGITKEFMGDLEGAIADYSQQIKIDSSSVDSYFLRGIIYDHLMNKKAAMLDYQKVIKFEDGNADAHFYIAKIYVEWKNYKVAMHEFDKAISYQSDNALYFLERAKLSCLLDDKSGACQDFEEFKKLSPDGDDQKLESYCN